MLTMLTDPWLASMPRVGLVEYRPRQSTHLDMAQAAGRVGVGYETVRAWVRSGKLPSTIDAFGVTVVTVDDLDRTAQNRSPGGRPPRAASKQLIPGVRSGRKQDGGLVALSVEGGHVHCRCDCGAVGDLTQYQFRFRLRCRTQCPKKKQTTGGPKRNRSFVGNYNKLIRGDRQNRHLPVSLTYDEYVSIRSPGVCSYCNGSIRRTCIGLDRLDNTRGYHSTNVVACCAFCNNARGHLLSPDEFRAALAVRVTALPPGTPLWNNYRWRGSTANRERANSAVQAEAR